MRLLLTCTDAGEAALARRAGADLVDVKDPRRGSLGAPRPSDVRSVARRLGGSLPVSVALGDGPHRAAELERRVRAYLPAGPSILKLGLAGTGREEAAALLSGLVGLLAREAPGAGLAAVGFADGPPPGPPVEALPALAAAAGCRAVMLDTRSKGGPGALERLGLRRLEAWTAAAHEAGLLAALAGGVGRDQLALLPPLGVDVVGVRGAACVAGRRTGRLAPARCRALVAAVRAATDREASGGTGSALRRPALPTPVS